MMEAATSPDAKIVPVPASQETLDALEERLHSTASQETLDALKERLHSTTKTLETRISTIHTRIHRFPHHLIGISGMDKRYVVPSVVAIGPYHHGQPHLQEMEEVKHAAAHCLCRDSGHTVEEVYAKVFSVAGDARCCYADNDASLEAVSYAEFATMMFLDGCFLVWYIAALSEKMSDALAMRCQYSSGPGISKDILLLENQIPWVVLEALIEFRPLRKLQYWISACARSFFYREKKKARPWIVWSLQVLPTRCQRALVVEQTGTTVETSIVNDGDYNNKPPHLLGLLRSNMIRGMPPHKSSGKAGKTWSFPDKGAVYLAQIGLKITASRAKWFADMNVQEKIVSGELSLSPLRLGLVSSCTLVNMAALEATGAFATSSVEPRSDGYVMSSYISTMAMLMDREEDVHELRRRGVLSSNFSNAETLAFFKGLSPHLRRGFNCLNTMGDIDGYMRRRPARIALHKFVYNNYRIIAAILSIAGVLVSILKALYSLKKP